VGNHLVNGAGDTIRLLGVNRQGPEYTCVQGNGIFDGPTADPASINAMAGWRMNAVRVPLNEDCWLGINGVDPATSGANYRQAIQDYVANLHQAGKVAILDLHWNGPGGYLATHQLAMADADHSPAFWRSVATTFLADHGVISISTTSRSSTPTPPRAILGRVGATAARLTPATPATPRPAVPASTGSRRACSP